MREKNRGTLGPVLVLAIFMEHIPLFMWWGHSCVELFFSQGKSGRILQYQPSLAVALPSSDLHSDCPATTFPETSAEDKRCFQK